LLEAGAPPRTEPLPPARIVAAGVAAGATAVWVARYGLAIEAAVVAAFFGTLAVIAAVDVETRRIPNKLVLPAAAAAFALVALLHPEELRSAAIAAGGAFLFFFVPGLISPRLVGMGDAKLALLIGVMLGDDILAALFVAAFSAGFFAAVWVAISGRRALKAAIPFGPFLACGAVIALVAGGGTLYS
jgi:leader peptidase (prepilin peptidase) / N-methyltransferase